MGNLRFRNIAVACIAAACLAGPGDASAQTCAAVTAACLQPTPLADAGGARFAWGTEAAKGKESKNAWVARFERGSKEPAWRTSIGGDGDDTVDTATLIRGDELLVVGSTTSPALPGVSGRNAGGRDGFVIRLNAATGQVLSGVLVGGAGDEALSGAVADRYGNIHVVGAGRPSAAGTTPASYTVLEPSSAAAGTGTETFLTTFDAHLARVQSQYLVGKIRVKKPRIWVDCAGNLVIGVVALGGDGDCTGSWPDLVYEQAQIAEDYDIDHDWNDPSGNLGYPPGGWGYHALRWKEYQANSFLPVGDPPYILDWALKPSGIDIPKDWHPGCGDQGNMNTLETAIYLKNGIATDPPGGWTCGNHANMGQLALYAAHFFKRWGTPVYTHLGSWSNLNGPWVWQTRPVGLERVTFRPYCPFDASAYNGETIDDLCDLDVNSVNDLTCQSNWGIPGVDGNNFFLRFEDFEGSMWAMKLVWWARLTGWQRDIDWWWQEWYEPGEYLMDPPEGSEAELAILQEAISQSTGRVVRPGSVDVTRYANGTAACTQTVKAHFAASE